MNKKLIALFLALALLLCACGEQENTDKTSGSAVPSSVMSEDSPQWVVTDILLPDGDEALCEILEDENLQTKELCSGLAEDIVYRVLQVSDKDSAIGVCIQTLTAPYDSWECTPILSEEWMGGSPCIIEGCSLSTDGSVHFLLSCMDDAETAVYSASWTKQDGLTLKQFPNSALNLEQVLNCSLMYVDSQNVLYLVTGTEVLRFDKDLEKTSLPDTEFPLQITENPEGNVYLCGHSLAGLFGIRSIAEDKLLFESAEIGAIGGRVILCEDAIGYLCSKIGLWQFDTAQRQTAQLVDFQEIGYEITDVYDADIQENGSLSVLLAEDDGYVLLTAGSDSSVVSDSTEKIELELASTFANNFLKTAVIDFNRQSKEYHINLRTRKDGESYADFQKRIQTEVGSGGGPALLDEHAISLENAVRNGFLLDLTEDFTDEKNAVLESLWSAGEVENANYGIPYCFYVSTLVTSSDRIGNKESMTLDEFVQAIKSSGAQTAISEWDGTMLFSILASHSDLIDWENRKSYLNGEKAISFLEFAKEYGVSGFESDSGIKLSTGEDFAGTFSISGLLIAEAMVGVFQGKETYIGWPSADGAIVPELNASMLFVNQSCEYPEGAVAFIRFLLSDKAQDKLAKSTSVNGVSGFPVKEEALNQMFLYAQKLAEEDPLAKSGGANFMGYDYIREPLSGESIEKLRSLLATAKPNNPYIEVIFNILSEESPAYFAGNKSAQEVCDIIQNRVQLYLDEMN